MHLSLENVTDDDDNEVDGVVMKARQIDVSNYQIVGGNAEPTQI